MPIGVALFYLAIPDWKIPLATLSQVSMVMCKNVSWTVYSKHVSFHPNTLILQSTINWYYQHSYMHLLTHNLQQHYITTLASSTHIKTSNSKAFRPFFTHRFVFFNWGWHTIALINFQGASWHFDHSLIPFSSFSDQFTHHFI